MSNFNISSISITNVILFFVMFLLSILVGIAISFVLSLVMSRINERRHLIRILISTLVDPILIFLIIIGYSLGSYYLKLPFTWFESITSILLYFNFLLMFFKVFALLFSAPRRLITIEMLKNMRTIILILLFLLVAYHFKNNLMALVAGVPLFFLFYGIAEKTSGFSEKLYFSLLPVEKQELAVRYNVQTHLFLDPSVTEAKIREAIRLIEEAIDEVLGVGTKKEVLFSGFASGGFDIHIKYCVSDSSCKDRIRNDINLAICRKLEAAGIRLASGVK